jgi:hypothetical protein
MTDNAELLGGILKALMATDALDGIGWAELAVVFEYGPDEDLSSTFGFVYGDSTPPVPVSFIPFQVSDAVDAYRAFLCQPGDVGFSRMLFQFNRVSGRANAEFAFEGDERWSPLAQGKPLAEVLRPKLA